MTLSADSPTSYSYCHETLQHYSLLDYFCVSVDLVSQVSNVATIDVGNNLSDHLPVVLTLHLPSDQSGIYRNENNNINNSLCQLRWDKANLQDYDWYTHCFLDAIGLNYAQTFLNCSVGCTCNKLWLIDDYYKKIVTALTAADALCIPRRKVGFYKYWWDLELDELKDRSIESHKLWIAAGRPMSGDIYNRKRTCKAQYRRSLRHHQRDTSYEISNELNDCLMHKDSTGFWRSWNSKFKRRPNQCSFIGGYTNNVDIANAFADNFASVCHHNSAVHNDRLRSEFNNTFVNYVGSVDNSSCLFDCDTVEMAIAKLKIGKAPGIDGVMAEHVLNCHHSLSLHLQALFNAIMKHSYVPSEFGIGITIPLLKDSNLDGSNMYNYRAITISPVLSKNL